MGVTVPFMLPQHSPVALNLQNTTSLGGGANSWNSSTSLSDLNSLNSGQGISAFSGGFNAANGNGFIPAAQNFLSGLGGAGSGTGNSAEIENSTSNSPWALGSSGSTGTTGIGGTMAGQSATGSGVSSVGGMSQQQERLEIRQLERALIQELTQQQGGSTSAGGTAGSTGMGGVGSSGGLGGSASSVQELIQLLKQDIAGQQNQQSSVTDLGASNAAPASLPGGGGDMGAGDATGANAATGSGSAGSEGMSGVEGGDGSQSAGAVSESTELEELIELLEEMLQQQRSGQAGGGTGGSVAGLGGGSALGGVTGAASGGSAAPVTSTGAGTAGAGGTGTAGAGGAATAAATATDGTSPQSSTVAYSGTGTSDTYNVTNNTTHEESFTYSVQGQDKCTITLAPGQTGTIYAGAGDVGERISPSSASGQTNPNEKIFENGAGGMTAGAQNADISAVDGQVDYNGNAINMTVTLGDGRSAGDGEAIRAYQYPTDDAAAMGLAGDTSTTFNINVSNA